MKGRVQAVDVKIGTGCIAQQVDHQNSTGRQRLIAIVVKAFAGQMRRLPVPVEAIDHQDIEWCGAVVHESGAIAALDLESAIIRRKVEIVTHRDHSRIDLGHRNGRLRQMAIAELGERTAAKSNHADRDRRRMEQQKTHHHLCVAQHQIVRSIDRHFALQRR